MAQQIEANFLRSLNVAYFYGQIQIGNLAAGSATLVAGTVTVSTTNVTANTIIILTGQNSSGTHGELTVSNRTAGTSFVITSSNAGDTRLVGYILIEPA